MSPLAAWTSFVVVFASLSYAIRFTEGKPDKNVLYEWSTVANGLVQSAGTFKGTPNLANVPAK